MAVLKRFAPYLALTALWVPLWRLPPLMGDDRFFAVASGLPWGRQTLDGLQQFLDNTWNVYNGRLADGIGPLYFALGDAPLRAMMALSYVIMTGCLWLWFTTLVPALRAPRSHPATAPTAWLLVAAIPFFLTGSSLEVGGHSIFLMAAVWNYIIPLNIVLFALYPFIRRVVGRPVRIGWELAALPLVFIAMLMHEVISVATVGLLLGGVVWLGRRALQTVLIATILTAATGVAVKFTAPGLWARSIKFSDEALTPKDKIADKLLRMGGSLSDLPTQYPVVFVFFVTAILAIAWLTTREHTSRRPWSLLSTVLVGLSATLWALVARRHGYMIAFASHNGHQMPDSTLIRSSILLMALALLSCAGLFVAVFSIPREVRGPLPIMLLTALAGTIAATSFAGVSQYGGLQRAHYVTLLIMSLLIACSLCLKLTEDQHPAESPKSSLRTARVAGSAIFLAVALSGATNATNQLLINHAEWAAVDTQLRAAGSNPGATIRIPQSLPCSAITWYYWPPWPDSNYAQWRTYYGLADTVQFHPVPPTRPCFP